MSDEGARALGKKLLEEVQREPLSAVMHSLRELQPAVRFAIPELDALLPAGLNANILELISPPPAHHPSAAGKTSLLYLIIAQAILPPTSFSPPVALGGQHTAVVLFDPLNHFHVPRLASVAIHLLYTRLSEAGIPIDRSTESQLKQLLRESLCHLHIFRPPSWSTLLATLRSLPAYLLDPARHQTLHRCVHSIILEDTDAYVSSIRNAGSGVADNGNSLSAASTQLTTHVQKLATLLSCAVILTSYSVAPSLVRPTLPASWPQGSLVTRLALRRVEMARFAPTVGIEEAESERQQHWEMVRQRPYVCRKVDIGAKGGEGFSFRVGTGVEIEG